MTYQPPEKKAHNINVRLPAELHEALKAAYPDNHSDGVRYILKEYFAKEQRRASRNRSR